MMRTYKDLVHYRQGVGLDELSRSVTISKLIVVAPSAIAFLSAAGSEHFTIEER